MIRGCYNAKENAAKFALEEMGCAFHYKTIQQAQQKKQPYPMNIIPITTAFVHYKIC